MTDLEADPPTELALVMPFVVCTSQDGPFDDAAYVAGYEAGLLDQALEAAAAIQAATVERTIRAENIPQADLIAMRHGFSAVFEGWGTAEETKAAAAMVGLGGWTRAVFTRGGAGSAGA